MQWEYAESLKPEIYVTICVCSDHIITGRLAILYNTTHQDWMLLLNLGYNAKIRDSGERSARVKRCDSDRIYKSISGSWCCEQLVRRWRGQNVQPTVSHSDIADLEESLRDLTCLSLLAMHAVASCIHITIFLTYMSNDYRKTQTLSSLYLCNWQLHSSSPLIRDTLWSSKMTDGQIMYMPISFKH